MSEWSEKRVIELIQSLLPGGHLLTDDCGVVSQPKKRYPLITSDSMHEGTHFNLRWHPPQLLAKKLFYSNLSDIDSSGGTAEGFQLTLGLSPRITMDWITRFLESLKEESLKFNVSILGGDTYGVSQEINLGMTVLGSSNRILTRTGLSHGETIFCDGMLGQSSRGLRRLIQQLPMNSDEARKEISLHLDPRPNIGLGVKISELTDIKVCMDLSDGLSKDLRALADINNKRIQLSASLDQDELHGGEDFLRLFASSISQQKLEAILGTSLFPIATVIEGPTGVVNNLGQPIEDETFNHFHFNG